MIKLEKSFKRVRYIGWETSMSPVVEREKRTMQYNGYDGVFSLDAEVISCLEDMGADVREMVETLEL